ncbi:hypothetical protein [Janibacter terrae]|uniref:hypothetical protein n=1 Tax=Janibacter terrae TaxID=103817 RepID=UPI0031F751D8
MLVALSLPLLAACSGDSGGAGEQSSASSAPKTLDAAQASAQEWADRIQSEDYAGAWDLMAREYRVGVKRDDFVAYSQECTLSGPEITATGVRLEGDEAVVRLEVAGIKQSRSMVYEAGTWLLKPSEVGRQDIGKSAEQMIADAKASGGCAGGS